MGTIKGKLTVLGIVLFTCLSVSAWAQKKEDGQNGKGNYGKHGHHRNHGARGDYKNGTMADKVYRITQADSIQAKKMKPIVDKASNRLRTLRADYQKKEKIVLDSLNLLLKPLLKDDQKKRLDDFNERKGK